MCTPRGGIECDLTVTRLAEDRFYVVSAAATAAHDYAWIAGHLPSSGRDALFRQREEGVRQRLACLTVDAADADPHSYEPTLVQGSPIGYVASGGYGHTVGTAIALAYLPIEYCGPDTELEVVILGEPKPARVVREPLYDPENERLLA